MVLTNSSKILRTKLETRCLYEELETADSEYYVQDYPPCILRSEYMNDLRVSETLLEELYVFQVWSKSRQFF